MVENKFFNFLKKAGLMFLCINAAFFFNTIFSKTAINDIFIKRLSFSSDVRFDREEFLYLSGLKENSFVSINHIKMAKKCLMQKGRFFKVKYSIHDLLNGKHIHFSLISSWILNKIKLSGIWFGKQNYYSLYRLQPGDRFDISVHDKDLQSIKQNLIDNGYFNCVVSDEFIYNKKNKIIDVKLYIKKGKRFVIDKVFFTLKPNGDSNLFSKILTEDSHVFKNQRIVSDNLISKQDLELYSKMIKKSFAKKVRYKVYKKELISKHLKKIKLLLKKKGFINPKVVIAIKRANKSDKIILFLDFILGKKQELKFQGNHFFSKQYIKSKFFDKNYPSWFFSPEVISQELLDEYHKKGYWNVTISCKKEADGSFLFNILERNPITINNILIRDENISTEDSLIQKKAEQIFLDLKNKVFSEVNLENKISMLSKLYLSNGFWNFNINNKQFIKNKIDSSCDIIITIDKGKQYFWAGFAIDNISYLKMANFLNQYPKVQKDNLVPFNFYWLREQKQFLLKKIQKDGYWYADITPNLEDTIYQKDNIKVFVTWNIKLGPQIKFGKVFVKGNTKLSFKKILKELSFKKGSVWSEEEIDLTRRNLKKLDVFKTVQIESDQISLSKESGVVPINLTLVDDDPLQATFRLGYFLTNQNFMFKRASTYRIGTSLILKNPTNNLDKFSLNADLTRFERKLDVEYKQLSPFNMDLKNSRLVGKIRAYSNKSIHPVEVRNSNSAYEAQENGFMFGFNNEFKKDYFWRFGIGNEWIRTSKVRGNLNLDSRFINETLPYLFFNPSFIIEKVDNKIDVKKGSMNFFSFRFMIPEYTGKPFGKLMTDHSVFLPINKETVFAVRVRLGYILKSEFSSVQPSHRFYLGGPFSVRGYEKDALSPYGTETYLDEDGQEKIDYTVQGGSGMLNANLELRFPLYKSLRGVLFQDLGVLSQSGFSGFKGKWFPSTGFGFRYKTPIGPIRFDIGFKWKHLLPGDTSYAWYLTLGEAF